MPSTAIPKVAICIIRFLQLAFNIILLSTLSYITNELLSRTQIRGPPPREVIVPEVVSALAILTTTFGIAAIFLLRYYAQLAAAVLDFCVCAGYIVSAVLLNHSYHSGDKNSLEFRLNSIRWSQGRNRHIAGLVSTLVVIQIIVYFCTTIFSVFFALKAKTAAGGERPFLEGAGGKWVPLDAL